MSFTSVVFAKTVARVIEVDGNAFMIDSKKSTKTLQYGSKISDLSEVMVEDGSILSLVNDNGSILHVTGGSLLKFYNGISEIKSGQVWVISKGAMGNGVFHTSNSIVNYGEGQFIYSFDNVSGKTQVLALTGNLRISNALEPNLKITVPAGHFSLVDQKYENGLPRTATKVGLSSYKNFKNLFVGFNSLRHSKIDQLWASPRKPTKGRKIASVNDQFSAEKSLSRGKIIKFTTYKKSERHPASAGASPLNYYKKIKKQQAKKYKKVKNNIVAPVYYYGFHFKQEMPVAKKPRMQKLTPIVKESYYKVPSSKFAPKRTPASVKPSGLIQDLKTNTSFEKSFMKNANSNQRHTGEVNSLIDELKSYKQEFKKNY
jgi:hypothetical protein